MLFFQDDRIKNYGKYIVPISIALIVFWFHYPWYSFDSCWYIGYIDFFTGESSLASWNPVRGFSYPLILYIAHVIKPGYIGLQIVLSAIYGVYCFYVLRFYYLIKGTLLQRPKIIEVVFINIVMFYSPMIWGYAHIALTEFVAATVFVIYLYVCYKFLLGCKDMNKTGEIIFVVKSSIILIFLWFLKQNYAIFVLGMLAVTYLLVSLKNRNVKCLINKALALILVTALWLSSIAMWNNLLSKSKIVETIVQDNEQSAGDTQSDESSLVAVQGVSTSLCLRYFSKVVVDGKYYGIVSGDNDETLEYFESSSDNSDIKWLLECFRENPKRLIRGFMDSYGLIAAIYSAPIINEDGSPRFQLGMVDRESLKEIWQGTSGSGAEEHYGLVYYHLSEMRDYYYEIDYRRELLQTIDSSVEKLDNYGYIAKENIITNIMSNDYIWIINMAVFSMMILSIPVLFIIGLVVSFRKKRFGNLITLLTVPSILYLAAHIYIGANIDRYAIPIYVVVKYIVVILTIYIINTIAKVKNEKTNNNTCI
ncbi:hypothetical protein SAMN02910377_00927 [Pseudobutyrivibrio ruminis]|uniref:Glycosyltransferase RgtA/B/C/D-like domain-containing protein n=1 Tax=Pseudobutyrivibrio ruminis TaxID=46206 RepID=A0A1H7H5D3_9FIRM|nr:hypothetical protein [Pseudobutyrivibrio ruminis]SEK45448.1 hypothetical protein SAMN02910377_00927 [Pseudobutyrivibrio ruminis]